MYLYVFLMFMFMFMFVHVCQSDKSKPCRELLACKHPRPKVSWGGRPGKQTERIPQGWKVTVSVVGDQDAVKP